MSLEPCIYDPRDEHYGNRMASVQFRTHVWQSILEQINFTGQKFSFQIFEIISLIFSIVCESRIENFRHNSTTPNALETTSRQIREVEEENREGW